MSLVRNAVFNFGGALVPALAALLTVPVLVAQLGSTQYGVLVLVTSIVGYFAILDINATAGSVKYIAQYSATGDGVRVRRVLSFGAALYLGIGVIGGVLIAVFARPLAHSGFQVPPELQEETTLALRWASGAFLLGQVQAYLQSVPQALQRYDLTGRMDAGFGTAVSVLSMLAAWLGLGLVGVIVVRLSLSAINVAVLLAIIRRILPNAGWMRPDASTLREVGSFSLFSYLTRLAAISAANTDKLLIGALVDMRSLAYYSVPFVLVNRVYALAFRLAQVMFPRASSLAAQGRLDELRRNYLSASRYLVFINAALLLLLVTFAPEAMRHWAGAEFGRPAIFVMVMVSFAIFLDSLTNLPSLVNDGLGHPKNSGIASVSRAAVGFAAAWFAVELGGIEGAAIALVIVASLSMVAFVAYVHGRSIPVRVADLLRHGWAPSLPVVLACVFLALASSRRDALPLGVGLMVALATTAAVLVAYGWWVVLLPRHRRAATSAWMSRLRTGR